MVRAEGGFAPSLSSLKDQELNSLRVIASLDCLYVISINSETK